MKAFNWLWSSIAGVLAGILVALMVTYSPGVNAQGPGYTLSTPTVVRDSQSITVAAATIDTTPTPSTGATQMNVMWKFATVTGSYTTCTAQAKTTYDGSTYLTLGSAVTVTTTSSTINAWTILSQLGTTSVTTSAASSTVALGFGIMTKLTYACSGAYGTSAPGTVSFVLK